MTISPDSAREKPGLTDAAIHPGGVATSPVAVVWCRQVDNEAESPGYTTVPEEFPGLRDTLDAIRIVGHLTVNVADTHDYWDPDPAQQLSYYPNIFLYPACGGRYTCVGRMFLSTEDRPRLGMKTLVLDTVQLLASGDFGGTVLRWHASMGGPRGDGGRPPPVPDPRLYDLLGEGLLFHKGSTEPVVAVASDDWEASMQVVLDLIRYLPASLTSLGAVLAFPYFLPQPKTNLHELTEQLPLGLALMRVPRGEAAGDRHDKRMASWESTPVTFRDVTAGVPATKSKDISPVVLQLLRERNTTKLAPIVQRVDLVELPRLRTHLLDPERQGGRDRRKEMWRIGTAMESAALLLQRSRGRHIPVNVETAKRAQEYVQARLPEPSPARSAPEPPLTASYASSSISIPNQHPPWLQRAPEPPSTPSSGGREVVPVSVSEDPSLLPAASRQAPPPATSAALAATSGGATGPAAPLAPTASSGGSLTASPVTPASAAARPAPPPSAPSPAKPPTVAPSGPLPVASGPDPTAGIPPAVVSPPNPGSTPWPSAVAPSPTPVARLPVSASPTPPAVAPPRPVTVPAAPLVDLPLLRQQLLGDVQKIVDERVAAQATKTPPPPPPPVSQADLVTLRQQVTSEFLTVLDDRLAAWAAKNPPPPPPSVTPADLVTLRQEVTTEFLTVLDDRLAAQLAKLPPPPRGLDDPARQEIDARLGTLRQSLEDAIALRLSAAQELGARDQAAWEARQRELLPPIVSAELDRRWSERLQPKLEEFSRNVQLTGDRATEAAARRVTDEAERIEGELRNSLAVLEESLRSSLSSQMDLHLGEAADRESAMRGELTGSVNEAIETRLKELAARQVRDIRELEQRVSLLVDGRHKELQEKLSQRGQMDRGEMAASLDTRLLEVDGRVAEKVEAMRAELQDAQVRSMAELQVRLQAYTDQKLREDVDRERQKYIELLARLKGEVEAMLGRLIDAPKFDGALRERIQRGLETQRIEIQRLIDTRVASAEDAFRVELAENTERLQRVEADAGGRKDEMLKLEETVRTELDDLDRRAQILADRLVPVVRKTWLRISELEKARPTELTEEALGGMRRELQREVRRLEVGMDERVQEIRNRMETAISNQGRVWLTLVRQLSQLTEDRRVIEESRALLRHRASADTTDEATNLEALPSLLQPRSRGAAEDEAEDDDEGGAADRSRRRRRPFARG